ncbi:unnamed protein product, partial [Ectocarpus fasciculatus]
AATTHTGGAADRKNSVGVIVHVRPVREPPEPHAAAAAGSNRAAHSHRLLTIRGSYSYRYGRRRLRLFFLYRRQRGVVVARHPERVAAPVPRPQQRLLLLLLLLIRGWWRGRRWRRWRGC